MRTSDDADNIAALLGALDSNDGFHEFARGGAYIPDEFFYPDILLRRDERYITVGEILASRGMFEESKVEPWMYEDPSLAAGLLENKIFPPNCRSPHAASLPILPKKRPLSQRYVGYGQPQKTMSEEAIVLLYGHSVAEELYIRGIFPDSLKTSEVLSKNRRLMMMMACDGLLSERFLESVLFDDSFGEAPLFELVARGGIPREMAEPYFGMPAPSRYGYGVAVKFLAAAGGLLTQKEIEESSEEKCVSASLGLRGWMNPPSPGIRLRGTMLIQFAAASGSLPERYLNEKDLTKILEDGYSLAHSLASSPTGLPRTPAVCATENVLSAASRDGSVRVGDVLAGTLEELVGLGFFKYLISVEPPLPRPFPLSRLAPPASRRCMDCERADVSNARERAKFDDEKRCPDCLVPFDFEERVGNRLLPRWRTGIPRFYRHDSWRASSWRGTWSRWRDSGYGYVPFSKSGGKAKWIVGAVEDDGKGLSEAIAELTAMPRLCDEVMIECARGFDVNLERSSGWYGANGIFRTILEKQSIPGRTKALSDLAMAALIVSESRDGGMTRAAKKLFDSQKTPDAKANKKVAGYLEVLLEFASLCGRIEESSGLKPYAEKARSLVEDAVSHMFGIPFVLGNSSKKREKRPVNDTVLRLFSSLDCPPSTTLALAAESGAGPEYSFFVQVGEPVTGVYFHEPDGECEMFGETIASGGPENDSTGEDDFAGTLLMGNGFVGETEKDAKIREEPCQEEGGFHKNDSEENEEEMPVL